MYEMSGYIAKQVFIQNYLVWHQYGEVQAPAAYESDRNDDEDRMYDMIVDIDVEYDLGSGYQHRPPELQNFYKLPDASDKKVHDDINLSVQHTVKHLMAMKLMYNYSNQCYNDIVKLIIGLIPMKHNMSKDVYLSKKIVAGLGMNYEKIDVCEKEWHFVLEGAQG
jgi:hypothetical protein